MSMDSPVGIEKEAGSTVARVALGTRISASSAREMVCVLAGEDITKGMFLAVDEDFKAMKLTKALADDKHMIACADELALASGEYGYVSRSGVFNGNVVAAATADSAFYTSATAGTIDDDPTSQTLIYGIVNSAAGATGATTPCIAACLMHA